MNKELCLLITFSSLNDALELEECASHLGRLIPVPRIVKAGCGMCFKAKDINQEFWIAYLKENHIKYEQIVEVMF